jgi:dihydrodipicolinate synthase/N-acetylneuraminate lyase
MKRIAAEIEAGNHSNARELQFRLIDIYHRIYGPGNAWWCAGQKYALEYMGIISSAVTRIENQHGLPEEMKERIRACIDAHRAELM